MILGEDNDYTALLDTCVLVPMCLCDTLLRLATRPAIYPPLWNNRILKDLRTVLESKLKLSMLQAARRIRAMMAAFPEALVFEPPGAADALLGLRDEHDRHVLAAAIVGGAHAIVTENLKDFPKDYLAEFDIVPFSADEFLLSCLRFHPALVLDKISLQAEGIRTPRDRVLATLNLVAPQFVAEVKKLV